MGTFNQKIEEKLRLLPELPGVYLMKGPQDKIIYIGKATILKNRVRSYFRGTPADRKTARLVKQIRDFDYIICDTEREAVILEANLIRQHKPRYNILLKDDKRHPYLKLTNEDFPRLIITRDLVQDGSQYFGPYTDAYTMRKVMRTLEWLFPLRNCELVISENGPWRKPCLMHQLGKCAAPCAGKISKKEYAKLVNNVAKMIRGRSRELADSLEDEMRQASAVMEFEKAAALRDKLAHLKNLQDKQNLYFSDARDRDVLGFYQDDNRAAITVLKILGGKLMNKETYGLDNVEDAAPEEVLGEFLKQYYTAGHSLPYRILLPLVPANDPGLDNLLGNIVRIPRQGENVRLVKMARTNAFNFVENEKLKHMRKSARAVLPVQELKDRLNLAVMPRTIACFDISTIFGQDTVASAVFFENGKPKKKNYRRFIMRTVEGQNDFMSLQEALGRYLDHTADGSFTLPDLFVIDGGKGQLNACFKILQDRGFGHTQMISLAKRLEEIYLPGHDEPISLPVSSSALRLVTAIRDEAHRFAITLHRQRRSNRTLTTSLDEVKGLPENIKFALLKTYGSVENMRDLTCEQLKQVKGVGQALAERLYKLLQDQD